MRLPTIHTKVTAGSWKSILKPEEVLFFFSISLEISHFKWFEMHMFWMPVAWILVQGSQLID